MFPIDSRSCCFRTGNEGYIAHSLYGRAVRFGVIKCVAGNLFPHQLLSTIAQTARAFKPFSRTIKVFLITGKGRGVQIGHAYVLVQIKA